MQIVSWETKQSADADRFREHSPAGELEMRKNLSKDFKGATRMALMRALKWAPTWYVSADISTFISYPDLIQKLAIKGISGVSPDISSGGSFRSSQQARSQGTLKIGQSLLGHVELVTHANSGIGHTSFWDGGNDHNFFFWECGIGHNFVMNSTQPFCRGGNDHNPKKWGWN